MSEKPTNADLEKRVRELEQVVQERRQMEAALKESERHLRELIANVPGVVIQFRTTRNHVYTNEFLSAKTMEIFGLEPDSETILDEFYAHIPDAEKEAYATSMREAIDAVSPWTYEGRFIRPDGETIWFSGHAVPHDNGDTIIYYGILMDITRSKEMESSLRLTQFIFDKAPIGIWKIGRAGEVLDVNEQGCNSLGYSKEELCRMSVFDFGIELNSERWKNNTAILERDGYRSIEALHLRKNGEIFPAEVVQKLLWYDEKEFCVSFVQDITERKQNEESLREKDKLLYDIGRLAKIGGWKFDVETGKSTWTDEVARIYDLDQLKSESLEAGLSGFHGVNREKIENAFKKALEAGTPYDLELEMVSAKGTHKWVRTIGIPIIKDGRVIRVQGSLQDITERQYMEQALRDSKERLESALEGANQGIWDFDLVNETIYFDARSYALAGYGPNEFPGTWDEVLKRVHEEDREYVDSTLAQYLSGNLEIYEIQCRFLRKDGAYMWIMSKGKIVGWDAQGNPARFNGVTVDITIQKQIEQSLRESEARFKALHNASFGGITIHDKGVILECNQGLSEISGYSVNELIGMDGLLLIAGQSRPMVMEKILSGYEKPYEAMGLRKNGDEYPIRLEARNIPYKGKEVRVVEFRDISEQRKAEQGKKILQNQLNQAQKMESIGVLAGGIAHDFNNILSSLMGFVGLAKSEVADNETAIKYLEKVTAASLRARDLVSHILTFSRKTDIQKQEVRICPLIKESVKFIRASLPSNIEIRQDIRLKDRRVFGNPTQIHRIMMNLLTNAGYAMKNKGGVLGVILDTITIGDSDTKNFNGLDSGDYLQIIISDTGCGIPKELLDRVFDPFFTTKERGEGTGLGLSTVYGAIKEMGGTVFVYSEEGLGTIFKLIFPEHKKKEEPLRPDLNVQPLCGEGKILVVDDEAQIIEGTIGILSKAGYEVTGTTNSLEALEKIKSNPHAFDLILTDMTMPYMSGVDLASQIKSLNPDIPIILCTGFSEGLTKEKWKQAGIMYMAMKPMIAGELLEMVHNALKKSAGGNDD